MPDTTQHLLGQLADGRFPLRKLLGVSPNSAVFLTSLEPRDSEPAADAAIKLIPEDPANSDVQLERWCGAAALSHPGLLKILHYGRCVIDGSPCLYIVTERADEDLGQLLPQRALSSDEARGMLAPVLAALDYLHEKGFVHAGVKPSNIHAVGDNVKLSSDRILAAGESSSAWPLAAPFAAPESVQFPASDIWSLGFTLCETLSQTLPVQSAPGRFSLPALPAPFSEIVPVAIVEDATLRIGLDSVRSQLDPTFVPRRKPVPAATTRSSAPGAAPATGTAASTPSADSVPLSPEDITAPVHASSAPAAAQASAAAASGASSRTTQRAPLPQIDPLSVPLSPVEPPAKAKPASSARAPIPVSTLPHVNATIAGPRRPISPNPARPRSNTLFLVAAAAAILLAIIFVPRMLLRSSNSASPSSANSNAPATTNPATPENSAAKIPPSASTPSSNSLWTPPPASKSSQGAPISRLADSKSNAAPANNSANSAADKNANSRTIANNSSPTPTTKNSAAPDSSSAAVGPPPSAASAKTPAAAKTNPAPLTVVRKILPEVSEKARATINGTVRISVRVQLNPDGTVASAELANPAASQFFSALALKAAQQWQFGPPASSSSAKASSTNPGASDSSAVPTSATIRFDFTQTSTSAYLP